MPHALACADIKTADWSEEVAPFWGEVIKSAFTAEGIGGLLRAGWTTIKGALVRPASWLRWLGPARLVGMPCSCIARAGCR